jgi:ferredoxin
MKDQIIDFIRNFTAESPGNRVVDTNDRYYGEPLVRFATAGDQQFKEYKDIIGQFHLTPQEAFDLEFGEGSFKGGTVISVVLPVSEAIRKSNRVKKDYASPEWALLRTFGDEVFINQLVDSMVSHIQQLGFRALSPSRSTGFNISNTETGPTSNWSERHIAYVAGQGSFSLNDGFITEKGMAVRLISLVTDAVMTPDKKAVKVYNENCLFCSKGSCGACIKRCPVGAITKDGHDKRKCYAFVYGEEARQRAVSYGGEYKFSSGCGLCQTGVPCEFSIPGKR